MPGLLVNSVDTDGKAHKTGVRQHDVLYKYNDIVLNSVENLIAATQSGKSDNKLVVIRGSEILSFIIANGSLGLSLLPYLPSDTAIPGVSSALAKIDNDKNDSTQASENQALKNLLATKKSAL